MKFKLAVFILASLLFSAIQARADSVYEIIGTTTVPGNSANPGVGETINFSFELDYSTVNQLDGMVGEFPTLVGTPVITSFGPLGTFTLNSISPVSGYIPIISNLPIDPSCAGSNCLTISIDLLGDFSTFFAPTPVVFSQSWLYACGGVTTGPCAPFEVPGNVYGTTTAAVYAIQTPEPGTLGLFALGALALCLMKKTLTH